MTDLMTRRLRLRRLTLKDAPFIVDLLNQRSFLQNIGDKGVRSIDDACNYLTNGPLAMYEAHGHGLLAVDLRQDGTTIGICGLLARDELEHVDLGLALLPKYWRRGYAAEASAATLEYASTTLGLQRVAAVTAMENPGSIALLRKLGFHEHGTISFGAGGAPSRLFFIDLG